jgi:ribosomal peptide maturation radical SAM protein 1
MISDAHSAPDSKAVRSPSDFHVLLLDMPFSNVYEPNLGLHIIKAVLDRAGIPCRIRYANMEFAKRIGWELYGTVAELLPQEFLVGDIVFAPTVSPEMGDHSPLVGARGCKDLNRGGELPDWLLSSIPAMQRVACDFIEELCDEIMAEGCPQLVGFNLMFQSLPSIALATRLKQRNSAVQTVAGGANCEGSMGMVLHRNFPVLDYICRGEGEYVIEKLIDHLRGEDQPLRDIQGLLWRDESGETVANGASAPRVMKMDELPVPAYDIWLATRRQLAPERDHEISLILETGRGCWYGEKNHCIFCGFNGESLISRHKSPARALAEIDDLVKYGVRDVFVSDLILPHQYYTTMLPELAERHYDLTIFYEVKSNISRDRLALLKDAGVTKLQPGIESLNSHLLKLLNKGVSGYQNVRLLKWSAELDVNLFWNMLHAIPGERREDYLEIAAVIPLITHLRPPVDGCSRLRLDRFSPLFNKREEYGLRNVRPSRSYKVAYALPDEHLMDLAYYFEYDAADQEAADSFVQPVVDAVRDWHQCAGDSTFAMYDRDGVLHLFDERPVAPTAHARLRDEERQIMLACDGGQKAKTLAMQLNLPPARVEAVLNHFKAQGWVAHMDDRYLSLAVAMNHLVSEETPTAELGAACHELCRSRMLAMWKPYVALDREPEDVGRLKVAVAEA